MPLSGFTAEEWKRLTPARRVKQCRRMAEEARALAAGGKDEIRRAYLELAENWDKLADEIEKVMAEKS